MVTYYVEQNEVYKVAATVDCTVHNGNESIPCQGGSIVTFKASTNKVRVSDDNAVLTCISETQGDLSGLSEHVNNFGVHVTSQEKTNWNKTKTDLELHSKDTESHINADDRTKWDDHVDDSDSHVTPDEKAGFSGLVGKIEHYAGSTVPDGYLLCDGRAVSRTTYAKLFAAIGTNWGEGDGSSTFNLPNLIDRVIWGASTAGEYLEAGLPNITGSLVITDENSPDAAYLVINTATGAFDKTKQSGELNLGFFEYGHPQTGRYTKTTFDASRSSALYGKSSTVQPPAAKLIPIIKY